MSPGPWSAASCGCPGPVGTRSLKGVVTIRSIPNVMPLTVVATLYMNIVGLFKKGRAVQYTGAATPAAYAGVRGSSIDGILGDLCQHSIIAPQHATPLTTLLIIRPVGLVGWGAGAGAISPRWPIQAPVEMEGAGDRCWR